MKGKTLDNILALKSQGLTDGEIGIKYSNTLAKISKRKDFLEILELNFQEAVLTSDFQKFNFLVFFLQGYGHDNPNQKHLYSIMMDFVIGNIAVNDFNTFKKEGVLMLVLDVFWHQAEGLKNLNQTEQIKLYNTLKIGATFIYEISENGDEPFFAINKSKDLIIYQSEYGNSDEILNLFINHFDPLLREIN